LERDTMSVLEKIFGRDFAERYLQAIQQTQRLSEQKLNEIIEFGIKMMKEIGKPQVKYDKWDVLLCQVPAVPQVKKTSSGNYKIGLIWPSEDNISGPWISAFFGKEEDAQKVASSPGSFVVLVGKLRQREYLGGPTYSINVAGYRILEDSEAPQVEAPSQPPRETEEVEVVFEGM